jgi:hypothetical protein
MSQIFSMFYLGFPSLSIPAVLSSFSVSMMDRAVGQRGGHQHPTPEFNVRT